MSVLSLEESAEEEKKTLVAILTSEQWKAKWHFDKVR